jgi:hypothetical protein
MLSLIGAILSFILALFKEKQRGDIEDAGAAKAEADTARRAEEMVREGQDAGRQADKSPETIKVDPNNRLR